MDISKVQFEELIKNGFTTNSFEELDLNNDGVISSKDLETATDNTIKTTIQSILNSVDDDGELQVNSNEKSGDTDTATLPDDAPEGYVTVDMKTIETDTLDTLNSKLKTVENNLTLLNAQLSTLTTSVTSTTQKIKDLEKEKEEKQEEYNTKAAELTPKQQELTTYTTEYDRVKEEIEKTNNKIRKTQELEEMEYEESIEKITNDAIENYDPETDGTSFEAYFLKQMETKGYVMFSGIKSLNSEACSLSNEAKQVLKNITNCSSEIYTIQASLKPLQTEIDSITSQINVKNSSITNINTSITNTQKLIETNESNKTNITAQISKLENAGNETGNEVLAKISDAEKKLAIDNNVDITKCFVAQGKDSQYHIYDATSGESLARKYGQKGKKYKGTDIVPVGSGAVKSLKENATSTKAKAVYYFSEVNADLTKGTATSKNCTYRTVSPLAFDVNGDGIKTTAETVNFDIDGDGTSDIINNTSDWVLAFDKDGNGIAGENGSELFGNNTDLDGDGTGDGYNDGFEALKALAKQEGLFSDSDNQLDENDIELLTKKYGLRMTNGYGGESKTLSELGITNINLAQTNETSLQKNFDGNKNDILTQEGATFVVNGETKNYADIWHSRQNEQVFSVQSDAVSTQNNTVANAQATNNENLALSINTDGVVVLQGDVDYEAIKNKAIRDLEIPQEVLDKIIEYKEEEEEL